MLKQKSNVLPFPIRKNLSHQEKPAAPCSARHSEVDPNLHEKQRHFYPEPVWIPVKHCYDFVIFSKGLLSRFPKKNAGTEKEILYLLTKLMQVRGTHKDVAQAFWGRHDYITEHTGLSKSRISESVKALVQVGILIHEVNPGVGQWIAFSTEVIHAWKTYSEDDFDKKVVPETGTEWFRKPELSSSGNRTQVVPETGTCSYIEELEGFRAGENRTEKVDGVEGVVPKSPLHPLENAGISDLEGITYARRVQPIFASKNGYVDFQKLNAPFKRLYRERGPGACEAFTQWLIDCWEWKSNRPWLGAGHANPRDFRLDVSRIDEYRREWESKCNAST